VDYIKTQLGSFVSKSPPSQPVSVSFLTIFVYISSSLAFFPSKGVVFDNYFVTLRPRTKKPTENMESNDITANSVHRPDPVLETNTSPKPEVQEWPISPTFLSLRKGIIKKGEIEEEITEENANYNNDGIFYTDYLRGFLADLSHDKNVQNALSLFQFVPEDFFPHDPNAEDNNIITTDPYKATVILNYPVKPEIKEVLKRQHRKIIRIDSGTFVGNGKLCDAFRRCNNDNTSFCFKQDSIVGIFADEMLNEYDNNSPEYKERLKEIIAEYNQKRDEKNAIKLAEIRTKKRNRIYIHYTCPVSLYEEHTFPVYIHGKIIACLMLGQMAREGFDINTAFSGYREKMLDKSRRGIVFEELNKKIEYCRTTDEWEKKAKAIAERLDTFEKRIEDRIEHRNERYVNDEFKVIEKQFRYDVKNINIKEEDVFSQFTNALNRAFLSIREKFDKSDDGFIRMFALPISIGHDELVPIAWAGAEFKTKNEAKFNIKQLKGIEDTLDIEDKKFRIAKQRIIILNAASQDIIDRFDETRDFFLPGWLAGNEVAYIIWKRHGNKLRDQRNKKNFKYYRETLKNFYSITQECYSFIRGSKMELLLEATIRESAHESAHFILPAIDVVEHHLDPIPKKWISSTHLEDYDINIDAYNKYKDEVLESLNQLWEINSGSSLIFEKELNLKKKNVQVFYLLYKLKKTLDIQALDSHKKIYYDQSKSYVSAGIDVTYFNHALYNLLDNAIKYGHEGSNIFIEMDIDELNKNLIIRVVSYGIGIPENEKSRVYNLFERGLDASKMTRGTGLGMYIVQKVCKAHGGTVTHTSEKLSDYNIPVLFCYKYKEILANKCSSGDIKKFEKEISYLTTREIEQDVVNDHQFIKFARVFSSRINIPTYENIFTITIPLH
jgi:hypothetical protein